METKEQSEWVKWIRKEYPALADHIRPSMNGIKRSGRRSGSFMWNIMRGLGAQKSESDIVVAYPSRGYGSLVIEHKGLGMDRKLTPGQRDYLDAHNRAGNFAVQTRGLAELQRITRWYLEVE